MIDLTQDTPKTLSEVASSAKNRRPVTTITTRSSLPNPERPGKLPRLFLPSPMSRSPHVIFTSPLHHHRDRIFQSPYGGSRSDHDPPKRIKTGMRHPPNTSCTQHSLGSISHVNHENTHIHTPIFRSTCDTHFIKETRSREDPMLRIVDVSHKCMLENFTADSS